jgi:uncharacterized repeat protein (TIGR03803 family)
MHSSPSTTYTVGGNVAGLGPTDSVTLLNNGGDALTVSLNGGFTFSTRQNVGDAYAVTVQSHTPGMACSVGNGTGSGASSDVTSVTVSCTLGTFTIVYSFGSGTTDGMSPAGSLMMDSAGNIYGTTYSGGTTGVGTVFKISPEGTESILHSFAGPPTDGGNPQASLVMDSAGNLYGTSSAGNGTVFKINAAGTECVLYAFAGGQSDGRMPVGGLIMDTVGNLYGTTSAGGSVQDNGTVFQITPGGTENILHAFEFVAYMGSATDGGVVFKVD